MYPLDRRQLAHHVYSLFSSLRKTAIVLQVSHTTIRRWLQHPERKAYTYKDPSLQKTFIVSETIKSILLQDPFTTIRQFTKVIKELFNFTISKELVRLVIKKYGYTHKKVKYFSAPKKLPIKTEEFIEKREAFLKDNRYFVSIDETSFGRNNVNAYGYSLKGKPLRIQRKNARITTQSSVVAIDSNGILGKTISTQAFNRETFLEFLKSLQLPPKTVILLDNVSFHHSKIIKEYAVQQSLQLLYTPPYSPWFNPIEGIFSIIKRTFYNTGDIKASFDSVKTSHCSAFFEKSIQAFGPW